MGTTSYRHVRLVNATGDGYELNPTVSVVHDALPSQSIPAVSNVNGPSIDMSSAQRLRPIILTSGTDVTVRLQISLDAGATWITAASYALAATGPQAVYELPGLLVRLRAENAGLTAQSVNAKIISY